jgi:hypothetical protein
MRELIGKYEFKPQDTLYAERWLKLNTTAAGEQLSQTSTLVVQISGANEPIDRDCHTPIPDPCPQIARRFTPHCHIERSIKHPYSDILRRQRVQFPRWELCNSTRDLLSSAKEIRVFEALL